MNTHNHTFVCNRCNTIVDQSPDNVSAGYFAYCPTHDEDLYEFECKPQEKQLGE